MASLDVYDYDILEHTADIGLEARGDSRERAFEAATVGMAEIAGVWSPGKGEPVAIEIKARDLESGLVDWLGEVLWAHDSRTMALGSVTVDRANDDGVSGTIDLVPLDDDAEGTQIKAVTYHQLKVAPGSEGWIARVFFDV